MKIILRNAKNKKYSWKYFLFGVHIPLIDVD